MIDIGINSDTVQYIIYVVPKSLLTLYIHTIYHQSLYNTDFDLVDTIKIYGII